MLATIADAKGTPGAARWWRQRSRQSPSRRTPSLTETSNTSPTAGFAGAAFTNLRAASSMEGSQGQHHGAVRASSTE